MGQGNGGGGWGALLIAIGLGLLYYAGTGRGKDNSELIPDELERDIDRAVEALNQQFGEQWLDWGVRALRSHLQRTQPHLVFLVDVVSSVELASRRTPMSSKAKQQAAVQMVRGR